MKRLTALLGLIWAALNLVAAYVLVSNSFSAPTPAKEGGLAQLLVLLGGVALGGFALALVRSCWRLALDTTMEA